MTDPLYWMHHHTRTRDSHWREAGAQSPYRSFPDKPYFPPLVECFQSEPVIFIEKSRDLMPTTLRFRFVKKSLWSARQGQDGLQITSWRQYDEYKRIQYSSHALRDSRRPGSLHCRP